VLNAVTGRILAGLEVIQTKDFRDFTPDIQLFIQWVTQAAVYPSQIKGVGGCVSRSAVEPTNACHFIGKSSRLFWGWLPWADTTHCPHNSRSRP